MTESITLTSDDTGVLHVGGTTTIDRAAFVGSGRALRTAGLSPEGWYLYEFVQMTPKHKEGTSQKTGEPYSFNLITGFLRAHKAANYAPDPGNPGKGLFVSSVDLDPKPTIFKDFRIEGKGLAALRNAYKAVTGSLPQGDSVDYLSMAEELKGRKAWGSVFHLEDEDTGEIRETVTKNFRSIDVGPPTSIILRRDED